MGGGNDKQGPGGGRDEQNIFSSPGLEGSLDRVVLGTAQLGMDYGIANQRGRPRAGEAKKLVEAALAAGVRRFDTARSYGESERVLGEIFEQTGATYPYFDLKIITKADPGIAAAGDLEESLKISLDRLKLDSLEGLLLHREEMLARWEDLWGPVFARLKEKGLINKAGVSVYSPKGALAACRFEGLDLVQAPASVFDRRLYRSGARAELKARGVEVHIRSIFLQGLALVGPENLPAKMGFAREALEILSGFCRERGLEKKHFLVHYLLRRYPEARLVFGAESLNQVEETIKIFKGEGLNEKDCRAWEQVFPWSEARLVNPTLWPR